MTEYDEQFIKTIQDQIEKYQDKIKRLQRMKQLCIELMEGTKELASYDE